MITKDNLANSVSKVTVNTQLFPGLFLYLVLQEEA
jgi:hypothetical protein